MKEAAYKGLDTRTGASSPRIWKLSLGRLTHLQTENISVLLRREPVPNWYAGQSQKTDALPLSHGGSPSDNCVLKSHLL